MSRDESNSIGGIIKAIVIMFIIIAIVGWFFCARVVPAGSVGIVDTFGQVDDREYTPGLHWILPWSSMKTMEVKTTEKEYIEIRNTLTKEGLEAISNISIIWHLQPEKARDVYMTVAGEYLDTLITPTFMGILRDEVKKWSAEDIYTGQASQIQADVQNQLTQELAPRGITIESVRLRGAKFDDLVTKSISEKIAEKQIAEKMQYTIMIKKQQAEVAFIEADGQARANERLSQSLTQSILTQRLIDALGKNPNAVYVTLPSGGQGEGNGLSLIMPAPATPVKAKN